jgi:hypothetical protein
MLWGTVNRRSAANQEARGVGHDEDDRRFSQQRVIWEARPHMEGLRNIARERDSDRVLELGERAAEVAT